MVQEILTELGITYEITVYTSTLELLNGMKKQTNPYNLLILDILLGKQNGIKLAKFLRKKGSTISILFISSSKDFALEGYSVYPIHYLLKPVCKEQLFEVIQKEYNEKFLTQYITIPEKGGNSVVELNTILYIEVLNRKILIHAIDKDYENTGALKKFLQLLPDNLFVQCHKSFVVNMSKISKIARTQLLLKNGISIPVGRAYYQNALTKFISYIE